jgi:hypothetical protein
VSHDLLVTCCGRTNIVTEFVVGRGVLALYTLTRVIVIKASNERLIVPTKQGASGAANEHIKHFDTLEDRKIITTKLQT